VHDVDDGTLCRHCRTWLDAATKPEVRDRLLGQLARLGLSGPDETAAANACLRSGKGNELLEALLTRPALAAELHESLVARMELEMDQWPPPGIGPATARSVLLKHRRP